MSEKIIQNPVLRNLTFALGIISLLLGIAGAFLPLLPTTPFVLLAAWSFVRSSERAHRWLYEQKAIAEVLENWERDRSIPRRAKVAALLMIVFSLALIWYRVADLRIKGPVSVLLICVSVFILSRPEPK